MVRSSDCSGPSVQLAPDAQTLKEVQLHNPLFRELKLSIK